MDQTTNELVNMLSLTVLLRLKKQCEAYVNYTIDYKQVNNKNIVRDRQKTFAELLEHINAALVFKQVEFEKVKEEKEEKTKAISTMNDNAAGTDTV